jgi:hypothetical protein
MKTSIYKFLAILIVVASAFLLRYYAANVLYIDFDEPVYLNAALKYANYIRAGKLVGWVEGGKTLRFHPEICPPETQHKCANPKPRSFLVYNYGCGDY